MFIQDFFLISFVFKQEVRLLFLYNNDIQRCLFWSILIFFLASTKRVYNKFRDNLKLIFIDKPQFYTYTIASKISKI